MQIKEILYQIRAKRESLNLSQKSIADELNLNIKSYSNIENGNTELSLNRFIKISEILKTPPEHFLNPNQNFSFNQCQQSGYLNSPHFINQPFEEIKVIYNELITQLKEEINFLRKHVNLEK